MVKQTQLFFFVLILSLCFVTCQNDRETMTAADAETSISKTSASTMEDEDQSVVEKVQSYDPPNRVVWQKPDLIIEMLGDIKDKTIADIGAGSGAFSRRLAQQAKKVIAIEIDQSLIAYMDSIRQMELSPKYKNRLEIRKATLDNSNLDQGEADIIVLMNTFLYMPDNFRINYLKHLYERLPAGGKVVIIDFKRKRIPIRVSAQRVPLYQVENEVELAGFDEFNSDDVSLEYQYIVTAMKR